jgi:hypothetical protein
VALDFAGERLGARITKPEQVLPDYDVVFASGISAIEAMACGCAVVILGRTSCGELVASHNFDRFRRVNFSIAVNSPPPSAANIALELERFSAEDAASVCARVRQEADFEQSVDTLVGLYAQVIEHHRTVASNPHEELLAAARYLRHIVPLIKMTDSMLDENWAWPTRAETFEDLRAQVVRLGQRIEKARR